MVGEKEQLEEIANVFRTRRLSCSLIGPSDFPVATRIISFEATERPSKMEDQIVGLLKLVYIGLGVFED